MGVHHSPVTVAMLDVRTSGQQRIDTDQLLFGQLYFDDLHASVHGLEFKLWAIVARPYRM
jgi:hypothetical protein